MREDFYTDIEALPGGILRAVSYPTLREAQIAKGINPDPDPDPPSGDNIGKWLPTGFTPKVNLPRGHIGAFAGAEVREVSRTIVGETISNTVIDVRPDFSGSKPGSSSSVLRGCVLDHVTVLVNGHPLAGNVLKDCVGRHILVVDVDLGDAGKAGEGENVDLEDFVILFSDRVHGATDKHVDGVQMFRDAVGNRLVRGFWNWNNSGLRANTTAAVFTHDFADLFARDLTIVNPGGTWEILQLDGSGNHDVRDVHVWGEQKLHPRHNRLLPRAIVEGHRFEGLHNDVPGARDWL